jgi:hypothetical protein
MRTARTVVTLDPGQRPRGVAVLHRVAVALDRLTGDQPPLGPIRFTGYTTAAEAGVPLSRDTRVGVYEADYPDTP